MSRSKKRQDDEEDIYVVEKVINKRPAKDGKFEYLLKWQVGWNWTTARNN